MVLCSHPEATLLITSREPLIMSLSIPSPPPPLPPTPPSHCFMTNCADCAVNPNFLQWPAPQGSIVFLTIKSILYIQMHAPRSSLLHILPSTVELKISVARDRDRKLKVLTVWCMVDSTGRCMYSNHYKQVIRAEKGGGCRWSS